MGRIVRFAERILRPSGRTARPRNEKLDLRGRKARSAGQALRAIDQAPSLTRLLHAWAAAVGQPALVTSAVEEITGNPAQTFRDWATDDAEEFRA